MRASIIIIGDEILLGQVTDTNSGEIARTLGPMGWQIVQTRVVGDDAGAIRDAITDALEQSTLVITTGGLGPTKDDITRGVLMQIFGGQLVYDEAVAANVERIFARRGLPLNRLTRDQALVPDTCRVIQNLYGTAPIMVFECPSQSQPSSTGILPVSPQSAESQPSSTGILPVSPRPAKTLIAMPGVPFETVGMLHHGVAAEIQRLYMPSDTLLHHTLIASGISESALAERLADFEGTLDGDNTSADETGRGRPSPQSVDAPHSQSMHLAYLPVPGYIRLRLDGVNVDRAVFDAKVDELKTILGALLLHDGDATPAEILLERLRERGMTVATAESCTGGNIAHRITSIAGSSDCYMGSVVSYSNDVKHRVLGVSQEDLNTYGAVSQPVVEQMARGAARVIGTDCACATSGIAGPGGGTPDKPVGTVWVAVCVRGEVYSECLHLPGDRARVIDRATTSALLMLLHHLAPK